MSRRDRRLSSSASDASEQPIDRRSFVRLTGGALVVAAVGACDGDPNDPDAPTGIVRVLIEGLGAGATSAGSATITGTGLNSPLMITLPAAATGQATVPVGTYHVVYSAPAGYVIATGTPSTADVTVVEDETTDVTFTIVQQTSTLRIEVEGLEDGATGGSAEVLRTDLAGQTPITVDVPASGTVDTTVLPGNYTVTFTPPLGYQLAPGQTNPRNVSTTSNNTTTVTFDVDVVVTSGTLRLVVEGLVSATSGGSADVLRTDIGGQTPITVNVPAGGTVDQSLTAGTYTVTYFAPSGHAVADGETNPQEAVITADEMTTLTFAVEPVVVGAAVVFHSDWSTALGTSDAALRDTGKPDPWTVQIGNGTLNEVIPATGLGFPETMANVLKCEIEGNGNGGPTQLVRVMDEDEVIPVPEPGQSLFYRWYYRVETPDEYTVDPNTHPIQDGQAASDSNWLFRVESLDDGTFIGRFNAQAMAFPNNFFAPPPLPKGVAFRWELQVLRLSETTFTMHAKVFQGDEQVYGDADFENANGSATLEDEVPLEFHNASNLAGLNAGHNGVFGAGQDELFPMMYAYQGGFAVRTDTWCEEYADGI